MSAWRCLFWVQSLLGAGHLRRALTLAEAMAGLGAHVTVANGGPPGAWTVPAGVELAQLPPVRSRGPAFRELIDADGALATAALWRARSGTLLRLLADRRPHALVTEMFPFGRRAFRDELLPLLAAARERRPQAPIVAASVRDVLVSKSDAGRYGWMADLAGAWYDVILVHSDERLLPFAASFPLAGRLADRIVHTGFVDRSPSAGEPAPADAPAILVSAGGGAVGSRLLTTAIEARGLSRLGAEPWLLVAGANLEDAAYAALTRALPPGCRLARHRDDLPALMGRCRVSVSQAGYNTVVEGLRAGARMVLVPFAVGGEDEQLRRASRLAELGLATPLAEEELSAARLAAAIDGQAERPRPTEPPWSFDGARRSAEILADLIHARRRVA